jgi:hypothetical protein
LHQGGTDDETAQSVIRHRPPRPAWVLDSKVGAFTPALYDEAKKKGWTVISMKNDWRRTFPFDN